MRSQSSLIIISIIISTINATVPGTASANDIDQLQKTKSEYNGAALYPKATETRDLKNLDGIWNFRRSPTDPEYGYRNGWYEQDLVKVNIHSI